MGGDGLGHKLVDCLGEPEESVVAANGDSQAEGRRRETSRGSGEAGKRGVRTTMGWLVYDHVAVEGKR